MSDDDGERTNRLTGLGKMAGKNVMGEACILFYFQVERAAIFVDV